MGTEYTLGKHGNVQTPEGAGIHLMPFQDACLKELQDETATIKWQQIVKIGNEVHLRTLSQDNYVLVKEEDVPIVVELMKLAGDNLNSEEEK